LSNFETFFEMRMRPPIPRQNTLQQSYFTIWLSMETEEVGLEEDPEAVGPVVAVEEHLGGGVEAQELLEVAGEVEAAPEVVEENQSLTAPE
jgi:hypothetical protein